MAPKSVRAVFFDLGDTLIDVRDYALWLEVARGVMVDLDSDALVHAVQEATKANDRPDPVPPTELWRQILATASERPVTTHTAERFLAELGQREPTVRLFSDARRCLDVLHAQGRTLGVLSNSRSEESIRSLMASVGILRFFSVVLSSGTEGVAKPEPEIFRRALRRANVQAPESFYVGDLAYTDAKAARAAGWHSVWLHRDGTGFGEDPPEITSLLEVPLVIRRIEQGS
ncbi:MAG: HAD family hydrolase [Thermoplasmata archaeon]